MNEKYKSALSAALPALKELLGEIERDCFERWVNSADDDQRYEATRTLDGCRSFVFAVENAVSTRQGSTRAGE